MAFNERWFNQDTVVFSRVRGLDQTLRWRSTGIPGLRSRAAQSVCPASQKMANRHFGGRFGSSDALRLQSDRLFAGILGPIGFLPASLRVVDGCHSRRQIGMLLFVGASGDGRDDLLPQQGQMGRVWAVCSGWADLLMPCPRERLRKCSALGDEG